MAVQEQTPLQEYTANGITKQFDLEFDCESADHLIVSIDDLEVLHTDWYLSGNSIVFHVAPASGKQIKIQRNTPFNRLADYQSYNNSFRPPAINKEFDRIWWKLQELGVADWILGARIDALKNYVDRKDDELKAYLMEEIRKQGVALDQLEDYYNYLMQRLAQIAVDKGWDASFVVDAGGSTQQDINDFGGAKWRNKAGGYALGATVKLDNGDIVKSTVDGNTNNPNIDMTGWELADAALNSRKLKRENVSVWDFFTAEELTAYKANPTTNDASKQVQAFFDYCHANKVINANAGGEFYITKPINYTGSYHATNVMLGDLKLTTDKPLNYMLHITGQGFQYLGAITLVGAGGSASQRKTRCGLLLGHPFDLTTLQATDCYSTNLFIQAIEVAQVYDVGVYWGNYSHFASIGRLRGANIGSCVTDNIWVSNSATFSAVTTVEGDIFQSSTLTVDKLPYDFSGTALAYINNQLYAITGVNKVAKTITVYPRLPRNVNTGTIWYQQGAVLYTIGNDTSNLRVNTLQAITCGIGADFKALYGCNISTFISEYLGAGIVLSDKHLTTTIGNHVTSGYFEANIADIVYGWFGSNNMLSIAANIALNPAKIISLAPFRLSDDSLVTGGYAQAGGDIFLDNTTYNAANNAPTGDLTHASKVHFHHFWGDYTLNISQNLDKGRLFGKYSAMYVFAGAYAVSATGIITIKPPSGSVINNAAQMTIDATEYDSAIVVYIYAISSTNYLASVITPKIQV